jgi:hypothetical protein
MKALTRNTLLAVPLALVFFVALPRQGTPGWDLLDDFTLAFAFTFVGHYVEVLLLKIPGIESPGGRLVRVLGWFAGGLWCYEVGRWLLLLYGRDTQVFPPLLYGGFILVGLEFVLHGLLQAAAKPNFFSGQATQL